MNKYYVTLATSEMGIKFTTFRNKCVKGVLIKKLDVESGVSVKSEWKKTTILH